MSMDTPRLRIAQIAPLAERVPPLKYGGTERVIATLTDELVRRGHDVTLFASGDSRTRARLAPIVDRAVWRSKRKFTNLTPFSIAALGKLLEQIGRFDVVHSHLDYLGFP